MFALRQAAGEQQVELPLRVVPSGPGTSRAEVDELGRAALTTYESLALYSSKGEAWSLIRAKPKTGRALGRELLRVLWS